MTKHERHAVDAEETAPCSNCGVETPIDLLDAKDDGSGDYTILECQECYGPGWAPARMPDSKGWSE